MNTQYTSEVLTHILELTNYQGDKAQLIIKYLELVSTTAINDLILLREKSIQDEIVASLTSKKEDQNTIIEILGQYYEQVVIVEAFKKASEHCLTTLLKDLSRNLTLEEDKKVSEYIDSMIIQNNITS